MPTYATRADCQAYTEGLTIDDNAAFDRLIERAERQIDGILGPWPVLDSGRKFDPTLLGNAQALALKYAVCAQVEYRIEMGERYFVVDQHDEVTGPDYGTKGRTRYIGPKVATELRGSGLVRNQTARARP